MIDVQVDTSDVTRGLDIVEGWPNASMMRTVADVVRDVQLRRFAEKRGPNGRKWRKWSPNTRKKHPQHTLMHDTGDLFRSIKVANVEKASADVGTNVPYAKYHQFGAGKLPKREILGVQKRDLRLVEAAFIEFGEAELQ